MQFKRILIFETKYQKIKQKILLQRQAGLCIHELICSVSMQRNSTLQMFNHLYKQQSKVNEKQYAPCQRSRKSVLFSSQPVAADQKRACGLLTRLRIA